MSMTINIGQNVLLLRVQATSEPSSEHEALAIGRSGKVCKLTGKMQAANAMAGGAIYEPVQNLFRISASVGDGRGDSTPAFGPRS